MSYSLLNLVQYLLTECNISFQAFKLAKDFHAIKDTDDNWNPKVEKIFKYCHTTISALVKAGMDNMIIFELPLMSLFCCCLLAS